MFVATRVSLEHFSSSSYVLMHAISLDYQGDAAVYFMRTSQYDVMSLGENDFHSGTTILGNILNSLYSTDTIGKFPKFLLCNE